MADRQLRVVNVTRGVVLAERAALADSFVTRARGLLGRSELAPGEGLVIRPCNAVHTVGMMFPIDVVHLDGTARVLRVVPDLRPWRFGALVPGSRVVVELPAGTVAATGTMPGDEIELQPYAPGGA
ncbi:MAG: DUF192 domain-containing protein [Chloroflexi bacterium]|nr:DUF192 domain-containing protein [Chloroflexota bacterium]